MAEEAMQELTLDQELEGLRSDLKVPAKSEEPVPAGLGEEPAAETPPATEETLEQKLDKIDAEPEAKPDEPKLNAEQQQILQAIPNVQTAQQLTQVATNYQNFTGAFERGDFDNVDQMFEGWNRNAYDAYKEHLYQKYVASGEWVDRWIADKEGNPIVNHGMKRLESQINDLKGQLAQRSQQETQQQQRARLSQVNQSYHSHLTDLFNKIEFSAADRRWVLADINARVAGNEQIRAAIENGNTAAVNSIFKAAVKEYVTRDQQQNQKRETTIAAQDKHKPLVAGTAIVPTTGITDEQIKAAPRDQRNALLERKMDDDLAALARKIKK